MSQVPKEFIDALEQAHFRQGPCGSEFELPVPTQVLERANTALAFALTDRPVMLLARSSPSRAVIARLVLHRAGVSIENVYKNNLSDDDFAKLTVWLTRISKTKLIVVDGLLQALEVVGHVADGTYVFVC